MTAKKSFLIFTNENCLVENHVYSGIPVLIDSHNYIVEAASDWFRHLILVRRRAISSVRQFAYQLQQWWTFLEKQNIKWNAVDDYTLVAWRDSFLDRNYDKATVNGLILTVFRFYLWAEKKSYTNGLIGETDIALKFRPSISVMANTNEKGQIRYTTPLLIRTVSKPILATPTNDEISKVHEALAEMYADNSELLIRDSLILLWMEGTGLRRAETLSLQNSDIPDWDILHKLEEKNDSAKINITGKGNKKRIVWASVDLLSQTREYIENERSSITNQFRQKQGGAYKMPKGIFLSAKTGLPLTPDSVSQRFAQAFRRAGVKGSGHRIRARFLTNLVTGLLEAQFEKFKSLPDAASILLPAAQIAGHNHIETLRPYLDIAKKGLLRDTEATRVSIAYEKAVVVERRLGISQRKLEKAKEFEDLIDAVKAGNGTLALRELRKLQRLYATNS